MRTHMASDMAKEKDGSKVILGGWVDSVREHGSLAFLIIRDSSGTAQITAKKGAVDGLILKTIKSLVKESVVLVEGVVHRTERTERGVEIVPKRIEILSVSEKILPLDPNVESELDTRLDWRPIDLRKPQNLAIFKIQAKILEGFEGYLRKEGFIQIFTPCILGGASEGGAEIFKLKYYKTKAFLRQDPQLHRQLTLIGGYDKIFDIGPSWRAEESRTPRHLSEHRGVAPEISFIKDETDIMRLEEQMIVNAMKKVKEECENELKILGKEVKLPKPPFPELRFPKIYEILENLGKKIPFGEDYDRESEKLLYDYVKEKYKSEFFFVNRFPFAAKPFYVMKVDGEPQWARSVDLIFKGIEQSSGGQREHRHEKLLGNIKDKKMKMSDIEWFVKHFKYGVPPHGGFCIGIERFTMQLLDIENIKEAVLFARTPDRLIP
ncbi:MAG: aspartate--tRNA(Asn) ligase [Candidatus Aenigmarchaeota archaeon]|nr:aspartate--tRNA(Asn) ligase [Candidatus Aenigmarchaeota archaeon]